MDETELIGGTWGAAGRSLKALELCAGAGGLALAAAQSGFDDITTIDVSGPACETLRRNKADGVRHVKDWTITEADIREVDFSVYGGIDLISGGPPCQPFSRGGKRNGRNDDREMFPEFVRAIREARPRAFLIENVKGLLGASTLPYFNYVIQQLQQPTETRRKGEKWKEHRARLERLFTGGKGEHGYRVIYQVLNAADYGVPQRRERVFIVGVREDTGIEYSFPLATHSSNALARSKWITGDYWDQNGVSKALRQRPPADLAERLDQRECLASTKPWKTTRDAIRGLPSQDLRPADNLVANHIFKPGARTYTGHAGSTLDEPAKTIKAGRHGVPGGENMVRLDDGTVRYFTVRECARIQTFPDQWTFNGSWSAAMRQVGNAVPVTLGEIVSAPLTAALRAKERRPQSTLSDRAQ